MQCYLFYTAHCYPLIVTRGRRRRMSSRLDTQETGCKLLRCVYCKDKPHGCQHILPKNSCFARRSSICGICPTFAHTPPVSIPYLLFVLYSFLARDSMLSALYAIARPSVCLSVCPSRGWISRKRLKLGSCNFHRTVAPSL